LHKLAFDTIQKLIKGDQILAGHDVSAGGLLTTLAEMCFSEVHLGANIDLTAIGESDSVKLLFAENAGVVLQIKNKGAATYLRSKGIDFTVIGKATSKPELNIVNGEEAYQFDIADLRDVWYETSYLLDDKQTAAGLAKDRFDNYKHQPLTYTFPTHFTGKLPARPSKRPKAAVIREKGSNSEREMANALWLAGFDVKDVHMTDLISGRETLEDIQFVGAVGGFSNSDVLGSAKGWAGAFKYNEKARLALENFYKREDVLSIGICNGCQLFLELDLINPEHVATGNPARMDYNKSRKHESAFTSVVIPENNSVMLSSLAGTNMGVWISHGEGKFNLLLAESEYNIVGKYSYAEYPSNPNGSDYNAAMICSPDGRHLATMPHIERSTFQWNWAYYPQGRRDEVSPWLEAFINARIWLENR